MSPGLGLLLALLAQPVAPETGAWYLQRFGPLQPRDAAEERNLREAHEVFAALQPVADRQQRREPRLLPLQRGGPPEARALPDGTVVFNGALLELCFRSADRAAGRARLAFVLGHEMAHLASGDAWEAEAFASAERSGDGELALRARRAADLSPEAREAREARADEAGFLFAAMAGFDTAAVLGERGDFLEEWSARAGGEEALRRRGRLLRARLGEVADALPFFGFGVRLLQLGRFADARALLARFQRAFPGPEVESNLGLAALQGALAELHACDEPQAVRFLLPTLLDPETRAPRVRLRGGPTECAELPRIRTDLDSAERWLSGAVNRAPDYVPARVNLASLLLLRGEGLRAYSLLRSHQPEGQACGEEREPRLALLEAIALHLASSALPVATADAALSCLDRLSTAPPASAAAISFARARILTELGRREAARSAIGDFLARQPRGAHADEARALLARAGVLSTEPAPERVAPLANLRERLPAATRRRLEKARRTPFDLGDLKGAFLQGEGVVGLELRGTLEVVEDALAQGAPVGGTPQRVALWGGAEVLVFPGHALEQRGGRATRLVWF